MIKSPESQNDSVKLVRQILRQAKGAPAANDSARDLPPRRGGGSPHFGLGLMSSGLLSAVLSLSSWLTPGWSAIFVTNALVVFCVGAFYLDRAMRVGQRS